MYIHMYLYEFMCMILQDSTFVMHLCTADPCSALSYLAQLTDFVFLIPLIGVVLVCRWMFAEDSSAKSASASKIHGTSNYNR